MKKDCIFYKQEQCRFKQKEASIISCTLCSTYYKADSDIDLKDWFNIANTNKNFKLQIMLYAFWIMIALSTLYINISNKYDLIQLNKDRNSTNHTTKQTKPSVPFTTTSIQNQVQLKQPQKKFSSSEQNLSKK